MKIAILGYGHIGGTLGKKWAVAGHVVQFGVRNPSKPEVQQVVGSLGKNGSVSSIAEAIDGAEVVVFAVPGNSMEETVSANARALDDKIVIDATNNFSGPGVNSLSIFQSKAPGAKYYRAFNIYGWENFEDPAFGGVTADLFYCGPEGPAKALVEELIGDVGLRPVYVGGPEQVGVVDGVLALWAGLARGQKMGRSLAFKVLTR
jgi:8-hydroxy-5-deazaflavin:NADPH oxidoreductase